MAVILGSGKAWIGLTGGAPFRTGYNGVPLPAAIGPLTTPTQPGGPVVYRLLDRFTNAFDAAVEHRWLPAGYWGGGGAPPAAVVVPWHLLVRQVD